MSPFTLSPNFMSVVIQVEHLSKYYRLGLIGGGTLREDQQFPAKKIILKNNKLFFFLQA